MDSQDNRIDQILTYLAKAATAAAGGVNDAVQSASAAMGEKYSTIKSKLDLERLHCEQDKAFRDLGQTYFSVKTGVFTSSQADETSENALEKLLTLCTDKQEQIDILANKIKQEEASITCPVCNNKSDTAHTYCFSCGNKLSSEEPVPEDEKEDNSEERSS